MLSYQVTKAESRARLVRCARPEPGAGQIALRIRACALNFADLLIERGKYQDIPPYPAGLGLEAAGEVTCVGPGVAGFATGDRVAVFCGQGGLAEYGAFDAGRAIRIPDSMLFEDAAAFQIAYGTGHLALDHLARLQKGETLLVTGAAGGTGLAAVELGKLMGARVVAHARGAERLAVAKAAGADHLVDESEDLRRAVKHLGGSDVVFDTVGGDVFRAAFRSCNPGGRLLAIGFASGDVPQIPANHLMVKNLTAIGFYIGGYMRSRPDIVRDSLETLIRWHQDGLLTPHVSHVLPLTEVAKGMDLLRNRKTTGKVVILP